MKKTLLAIASILAIVAGCAKNEIKNNVADGQIRATIESPDTKATLHYEGAEGSNFLAWEEGDAFSLFDGVSNIKCTLTSGAGAKSGVFAPESEPATADTYYAVYPYSESTTLGNDGKILVEFPDTYACDPAKGLAEENGNMMIAKQSGTDIQFKNLCSYIRLSITGTETQILQSITINSKDFDQFISGFATVSFDGAEPSVEFGGPVRSNYVSAEFEEGIALSAEPLTVAIAVAPVFKDGFSVHVVLADGSYQTLTSDTSVGRNEIVNMPTFAFSAAEVAQIGDVKYTSLAAAVAAANAATEDVTIKLIDDVVLTETVAVENANCTVTLDMNSKVISAEAKAMDIKSNVNIIDSSAEKTGSIISATSYAFYAITGGITMNISDVAFEGAAQYGAVRVSGAGSVYNISGKASFLNTKEGKTSEYAGLHIGVSAKADTPTVNISGGTFESYSTYGVRNRYGICNITGGVFTGKTAAFNDANGGNNAVSITGGYFSNIDDTDVINNEGGHVNGAISGGYFTKELSAVVLAEGYVCAPESTTGPDGKVYDYKVKEGVLNIASVTIGGVTTEYPSLDEAIAAAQAVDEAEIKLLQDCALADTLKVTNALTIDLNDRTITAVYNKKIYVSDESAVLTITDNSVSAGGAYDFISTGGYVGIDITAGKLIFENGTIRSKARGASVRVNDGCEFYMYGGSLLNVATSTESYTPYALSVKGGKATIDAGLLSCDLSHTIYLLTSPATLNINGGAVVAKTAGKYPIYATTSGAAHVTTITNDVSEPLFVGGGSGDSEGRAFYNGYTVSKIYTKAGLFTSPYLGKPSSPNTYVAEGYKRVEDLSEKRTVAGVEYTFTMQVVPEI